MKLFNKKIVIFTIILTFSFFIFQGTSSLYADSGSNDKNTLNDKKSGIIEQQAEWDKPVKRKRSIVPLVIGGLVIAGGIIAAVVLLGKKKEDPRGTWRVEMTHPQLEIPAFRFVLDGADRDGGDWIIRDYIDVGVWNLRDGNKVTIRATNPTDFVLNGTIDGDTMEGSFAWNDFGVNGGNWTATRISGGSVKVNAQKGSIASKVK